MLRRVELIKNEINARSEIYCPKQQERKGERNFGPLLLERDINNARFVAGNDESRGWQRYLPAEISIRIIRS